ncbi:MAG: diguanylate cyclase [Pseudomonadota bacterium]
MESVCNTVVLVCDDEQNTLTLVTYNLEKIGFRILTASNGRAALDLLQKEKVDLILSDIMMPGIDGFDFYERVKLNIETRNVPFVFLTAKTQSEYETKGLRLGADEYIKKPFDPSVLIARIHSVLARRKTFDLMTRTDPLTHLLNRTVLEDEVGKELHRLKRYKSAGSLVFIDLDNFKHINDTYGHSTGDFVLIRFSKLVGQLTRSMDIAGRYGGEEFVLFLPETGLQKAGEVIERLLHEFRNLVWEGPEMKTTFSAGIAEAVRDGDEFCVLCSHADQAMYHAKHQGKDRVVIWNDKMEPKK